jgi:acetyl esterase/lipase
MDETTFHNLPPAYIAVGSQEVFLDEDVEYALLLARAGIPVELHVYPRALPRLGYHCAQRGDLAEVKGGQQSGPQACAVSRVLAVTCHHDWPLPSIW